MTQNNAIVPSKWAKEMDIPEKTVQEVKLFNQMGWALDQYGNKRPLSEEEQKMMCLIAHRLGLSAAGKQLIFLGNSMYVTKSGKISKARKDETMPYVKAALRPATEEEREAAGIRYSDPDEPMTYEHYWNALIFAKVDGEIMEVANDFGHACVKNINLKGKEKDSFRLCSDMAKTRATGRALSMVYDFFGVDSFEEVALMPQGQSEPIDISDEAEVETVEDTEEGGDNLTVQDVLDYMESNRDYLPSENLEKFTAEKLAKYTPQGLKDTLKMFEDNVEKAKKVKPGESPAPVSKAKPEKRKTAPKKGKGKFPQPVS